MAPPFFFQINYDKMLNSFIGSHVFSGGTMMKFFVVMMVGVSIGLFQPSVWAYQEIKVNEWGHDSRKGHPRRRETSPHGV